MLALDDITVLDFSTLLPGPLCTLLLAEAGARVIKIERPGGEDLRHYTPKLGEDSAAFTLLNRGKEALALDLKDPAAVEHIGALVESADVLVEQFRPGVMQRLGLDYATLARRNPRLIYCSITGFGQTGPKAHVAAHDLNYQAQAGFLALGAELEGAPTLPCAPIADIAGGAYPAVMNILLALRQRARTGQGCYLDIAMTENLFTLMPAGLGSGLGCGQWPQAGAEQLTGGSSRYQVYRTGDDQALAVAPLEDKFWQAFLARIGLPELADVPDTPEVRARVAARLRTRSAHAWLEHLGDVDTCVCAIVPLQDAVHDPHFVERGVFAHRVSNGEGVSIPALPVPIVPGLRAAPATKAAPTLKTL